MEHPTIEKIDQLKVHIRQLEVKLQSIMNISQLIHRNFSMDKIVDVFNKTLINSLGIHRFFVIYFDESWKVFTQVGVNEEIDGNEIFEKVGQFKKIRLTASSPDNFLSEFNIIVPIHHENQIIAYILLDQSDAEVDTQFLQTTINIIVLAIQNQKMIQIKIQQQSIQKEIELASLLQNMLFPSHLPSNTRMDISAKYIQREKIGGDYYDFIPLGNDRYALCIADVSGKGISAALLMSNFQASVRALFGYQEFELDYLIQELNKIVMNASHGEKFITCFIAIFNATDRELIFVNAGHNFPILTDGISYELLKEGTTGLGMFTELPFLNVGRRHIPNNTTLVLYTDGVVELPNRKGEFFEIDNLIKLIHTFYPLKMEDINALIFSKLNEWKENSELVDDTAVISCRFF